MRPTLKKKKKKITVSAATLLASVFVITATPAVYADDFCITNGAQAAHGCGYPTMEACRAASSGIGGICSQAPNSQSHGSAQSSQNGLAYVPRQTILQSKTRRHPKSPPKETSV
jgi:hypothetical protein